MKKDGRMEAIKNNGSLYKKDFKAVISRCFLYISSYIIASAIHRNNSKTITIVSLTCRELKD